MPQSSETIITNLLGNLEDDPQLRERKRLVQRHLHHLVVPDSKGGFIPSNGSFLALGELLGKVFYLQPGLPRDLYELIAEKGKFTDYQIYKYLCFEGNMSPQQVEVIRTELIWSTVSLPQLTYREYQHALFEVDRKDRLD